MRAIGRQRVARWQDIAQNAPSTARRRMISFVLIGRIIGAAIESSPRVSISDDYCTTAQSRRCHHNRRIDRNMTSARLMRVAACRAGAAYRYLFQSCHRRLNFCAADLDRIRHRTPCRRFPNTPSVAVRNFLSRAG